MREPGFYADVPEDEYHADRESLSQSGAKMLLESPALFRHEQEHPSEPTDAMLLGTLVHTEVFGTGQRMAIIPPTGKTKILQQIHAEAKAEAKAAGLIPVTAERAEAVQAMGAAVMQHKRAADLLAGGTYEVSAYAPDPDTGIMRRARFDCLHEDLGVDLKTTNARTRSAFAKSCANFGYHNQHAWYVDLARDLGQPLRSMVFIAVTNTEPYEVAVYELEPMAVMHGRELNERALRLYQHCTETGEWTRSANQEIQALSLPRWAYYQETA